MQIMFINVWEQPVFCKKRQHDFNIQGYSVSAALFYKNQEKGARLNGLLKYLS